LEQGGGAGKGAGKRADGQYLAFPDGSKCNAFHVINSVAMSSNFELLLIACLSSV